MSEQGDGFKIIVPQHHQQNADALCNIEIFYSFGHNEVSSALILPHPAIPKYDG
jgi:hypothetical protein